MENSSKLVVLLGRPWETFERPLGDLWETLGASSALWKPRKTFCTFFQYIRREGFFLQLAGGWQT